MTESKHISPWGIFKKTLAFGLEILPHLAKAAEPTTKPGAEEILGRFDDGEIGAMQCNYELSKLKIK